MTDSLVPYTVPENPFARYADTTELACWVMDRAEMRGQYAYDPDWTPEAYATDAGLRRKEEARRFLELLDPTVDGFTFQTFDDNEERKAANEKKRSELNKRRKEKGLTPLTSSSDPFAKIYNGTLDQHWDKLCKLNEEGAGVFITVNATDGNGRLKANIKRVRALFLDLDDAPIEPVIESEHKPHIVVVSSPGHFHPYMLVSDVKLDEFTDLQQALIARFNGDPKVSDLPRVLRLPGFYHRKGDPFLVRIFLTSDAPPYKRSDFGLTRSDPVLNTFLKHGETATRRASKSSSPTQKLNDAALADLKAWVPELFPTAKPYHEGFRVTSADLGRDLQEDISFRANGIVDFGVHDLEDPSGTPIDPREGKRTPIEIVMEYLLEVPIKDIAEHTNETAFTEACDWLRDRIDPEWKTREQEAAKLEVFDAGDDTDPPPPRAWLLGVSFARKFLSSIFADGGVGKTALRYAQLVALATGHPITGEHVFQRCRVLIISLEDDRDELRRRILAVLKHHGIERSELKGWLYYITPGGEAGKLMIMDQKGHLARGKLAAGIENIVATRGIDIVSIDPFVKSHSVEENSNSAIDDVVQVLTDLGVKYNIAVDAPHHTSKGMDDPGNASRGRGARAMKDAGRLIYTLTRMTEKEADLFGVDEEQRKRLIRVDSGKVNITRPSASATWFELIGIELENGNELYPNGDQVQTVEPWVVPDFWESMDEALLNRILAELDAGLPDGNRYTDSPNAGEREAWKIVVKHSPGKTEGQAKAAIKTWIKNKTLIQRKYHNPKTRRDVIGLYLAAAAKA